MNGRPLASAAYEAAISLYQRIRPCPDADPGDLGDVFSQLPGHVDTHVLDLPDGSIWAATFLAVMDDSADAAGRDQTLLVVHSGERINVYVYDQRCFEISADREPEANYDCGIMLSSDPAQMNEMDAYGMWVQLGTRDLMDFDPVGSARMKVSPFANATWQAVKDRYEQVATRDEVGLMARHLSYDDLPGHIASHELDFAGGNVWGLSFFHVRNDNPADPAEFIMLAIFGEELAVLVYHAAYFKVSDHRDEDAECDCGVMLCAEPAQMNEMDAFGLFYQLGQPPLRNMPFDYIPW